MSYAKRPPGWKLAFGILPVVLIAVGGSIVAGGSRSAGIVVLIMGIVALLAWVWLLVRWYKNDRGKKVSHAVEEANGAQIAAGWSNMMNNPTIGWLPGGVGYNVTNN
jgi:hypothetical protein